MALLSAGLRARVRGLLALIFFLVLGGAAVNSALADSYTYDALGRLKTVTYSNGGSTTYSYDAAGNRTGLTATGILAITTATLPTPVLSTAYSQTVATSGGQAPISFSISAGSLPTGLSLNASTGAITGTPTAAGAYSFTVQAQDSASVAATATKLYSGTIAASLTITTTTLPTPVLSTAYSQTIATSGGTAPISFNVSTGSLPAGLSLNSSTGAITGTPTTAGAYSFTIRALDATSVAATQAYSGTIAAALAITTTTLPTPVLSTAYSQTIATSGGTAPISFSISAGALPAGLSLNSSTGAITGTPTAAGAYSFTIRAQDAASVAVTQAYSGTIAAGSSLWKPINATSFTPEQYYEPWDAASITQSGGLVSAIADKSGHSRTATASGSARPTYSATGFDGGPGLVMNGGQALSLSTTKPTVTNASPIGDTSSVSIDLVGSTDYPMVNIGSGLSLTNPTLIVAYWSTSAWYLRVNGVQVATGGFTDAPDAPGMTWSATTLASAGSFGYGRFASTEGASANTLVLFNRGDMARGLDGAAGGIGFASATSLPTLAEAQKVEGYLAWASGIQQVLPGGHPYVGAAPTTGGGSSLAITTTTLPTPVLSTAYSQTIATSGGTAPISFNVSTGSLPAGLSLNSSTGAITGTPTTAGAYSFTIRALDAASVAATQAYSGTIAAGSSLWKPINATSFSPEQYYEPWDAASITQSGGLVSAIADKSGHSRTATASGSARPTYSATGFDGGPGLVTTGGQRMTVSTTNPVSQGAATGGDTTSVGVLPFGTTDYFAGPTGLDLTSPTLVVAYWNATAWYMRVNGVQVATHTLTDPPSGPGVAWFTTKLTGAGNFGYGRIFDTENAPANTLYLFNNNGSDRGLEGSVGGVGFASAAALPSSADIQKLEGYLAWASGIQQVLPGGHLYVGAAPTTP